MTKTSSTAPMPSTRCLVVKNHVSEYPQPIAFKKGDALVVGETYQGEEGWNDWFLCSACGHKDGWVPAQILAIHANGCATVREDYTARELNVYEGNEVRCSKTLNGWGWCETLDSSESGWIALQNLQTIEHSSTD